MQLLRKLKIKLTLIPRLVLNIHRAFTKAGAIKRKRKITQSFDESPETNKFQKHIYIPKR